MQNIPRIYSNNTNYEEKRSIKMIKESLKFFKIKTTTPKLKTNAVSRKLHRN